MIVQEEIINYEEKLLPIVEEFIKENRERFFRNSPIKIHAWLAEFLTSKFFFDYSLGFRGIKAEKDYKIEAFYGKLGIPSVNILLLEENKDSSRTTSIKVKLGIQIIIDRKEVNVNEFDVNEFDVNEFDVNESVLNNDEKKLVNFTNHSFINQGNSAVLGLVIYFKVFNIFKIEPKFNWYYVGEKREIVLGITDSNIL